MFLSTSLYTPPEAGEKVPIVLKPDLDFDAILRDRDQFEESVRARNMKGVDIPKLVSIWEQVRQLEEEKSSLEGKKKALNKRAKELSKQKTDSATKERVQEEGRRIREAVKGVNNSLNDLMSSLYPLALSLPNLLHIEVPIGDVNRVIESVGVGERPTGAVPQHSCLSTEHALVHPGFAYTQGDLVLREQELLSTVSSQLTSCGFTRYSMPDMYKPIAIEALGLSVEDSNETYAIETSESTMHLAGTSPMGFLAYYMMSVLEASDLPHRCFAVGRHYNAMAESSEFRGLHHQFQESRVELFGVSDGREAASDALLSQYVHILREIVSGFGIPFRIVEVSSSKLLPCMHRMTALEVWMPSVQSYVEVGNVCSCTDFISRRLKIRYPANPRESAVQSRKRNFAHTIHGTALKSSVLLSALLENEALASQTGHS